MSQAIHYVSSSIPGYGPAEGKCLLCSGGLGRAVTVSSYSSCRVPLVKNLLAKSPVLVSKRASSFVANSSDNRRNPDFSKQNKQNTWFPRNKNKQNHNRDDFENHEDSELLSSENGQAFSVSNSPMYKATPTPGPREKEIVELFRKVQAQLRERAAIREANKTEASGQDKENETVESLLKLLRKHSAEQGNKKSSSSNNISSISDSVMEQRDQNAPFDEEETLFNSNNSARLESRSTSPKPFRSSNNISSSSDSVMEQRDQNAPFDEKETPGLFNSNNSARLEARRTSPRPFRRPMSNFRRKSPVPRVKFQPVYTAEDDIVSNSSLNSQGRRKTEVDPEPEPKPYPELEDDLDTDSDSDSEAEEMREPEAFSVSSNVHEVFAETCESESDEAYHDDVDVDETDLSTQQADLSELKLSDLKVLAKSRGLKGYSKLKKAELVELLSGLSG